VTINADLYAQSDFCFMDSHACRGSGTIVAKLYNGRKDDWAGTGSVSLFLSAPQARAFGEWLIEQAHQVEVVATAADNLRDFAAPVDDTDFEPI
jgi:hypothetical protein